MCTKAVWLIGALIGLVWAVGVAQAWSPATPKLRLSVAAGGPGVVRGEHRLEACATGRGKAALGVVRGDGTHGTDGTDGAGADPITRHASRVRRRAGPLLPVLYGLRITDYGFRITRHVPASRVGKKGKARGLGAARWGPVRPSEGMEIAVSGGSAPGSPFFF